MGYEITKFEFKGDLASANFNTKFTEIETYLNNMSSEIQALRTENQQLKQQLNNKVNLIIKKSFNLLTDDIFKIPAGSYLFSGDSRTNANFPFQEQ